MEGHEIQSKVEIVDLCQIKALDLFKLIQRVYAFSNAFCEGFDDKYPNLEALQMELADANPGFRVVVAKADGLLAGYLVLTPKSERHLRHTASFSMGVCPHFQGRGVGKALVNEMLRTRPSNIEIIYLMVRSDNAAAIRLYEQFDFKKIGLLESDTKIDGKYFDGILMSRKFLPRDRCRCI